MRSPSCVEASTFPHETGCVETFAEELCCLPFLLGLDVRGYRELVCHAQTIAQDLQFQQLFSALGLVIKTQHVYIIMNITGTPSPHPFPSVGGLIKVTSFKAR